jgi:hypothetical protein
VEDDRDALIGLQAPEATLQLVAIGGCLAGVGLRRLEPEDPDLGRAGSMAPALVGAGIDEQAVQPGVEPIGIAQAGQLSPGLDEGFLDGVLGKWEVAEHEARDPEEAVSGRDREDLEGLVVTALGRLDECSRHPGSSATTHLAACEPYDGMVAPRGSRIAGAGGPASAM